MEEKTIRIINENHIIPPDEIDWNGISILASDIENDENLYDKCHELQNIIYDNVIYSILEKFGITKKDYQYLVKKHYKNLPKIQEKLRILAKKLYKKLENENETKQ